MVEIMSKGGWLLVVGVRGLGDLFIRGVVYWDLTIRAAKIESAVGAFASTVLLILFILKIGQKAA
jgi:hypothetical protein